MLVLSGASKRFAATEAVRRVGLQIAPQRTTVLIGPSGCGKSTLLRLMIGLLRPDEGEVRFDGQLLTPANVLALRRRMGYVIQEGGLFPHLTARRNVTLMARYLSWTGPAREGREERPSRTARGITAGDAIEARLRELAGLTKFPTDGLDRYPVQLSGGQCQRVSLMRALMLDPSVLLLDEPLGALDPLIRAGLQDDLRDIFRSLDKTVVMVTHDMAEAAFFGDTIVLMREGRIVQEGTLESLLESPADPFVTDFINAQRRPAAALVEGAP
jgi:osmoprotectant transport system ATP-binding protein